MKTDETTFVSARLLHPALPALIDRAGKPAARRFREFLHRQHPQQKYTRNLGALHGK
jgi:hypothetical protein